MKLSIKSYVVLALVFVSSLLAALVLPVGDAFKGIIATPGVVALLGVIYQLIRDNAQFERDLFLQQDQQIFNVGMTSHMANVAFDKHVEFCEKYMMEVHETIGTLFREGPSETAMQHARRLFETNKEYSAWIPKKLALELEPFENAVYKIGNLSHLIEELRGTDSQVRSKAIEEAYELFKQVMELEEIHSDDPDRKNELAKENIKEKVRSFLGINELTEIRSYIIKKSVESMKSEID